MTTDLEIKNAKSDTKDYTLNIGDGLSILIKTSGGKLWRYRYSYGRKRCMISLGKYPQISLKQAKSKHREYLNMLEDGTNPSTYKHMQKVKISTNKEFSDVALEWHARRYQQGNERYNIQVLRNLEKNIFPVIGKIPIQQLEAPMLFNLIEGIQDAGNVETGKRINSYCSMVFRYGVAKGYCNRDITQDYKGMLKSKRPKHMPTLTESDKIGELLDDIANYQGTLKVKYALQISAYIFVRPSELVNSKWEYIDFEKSQWIIPATFMKMKRDHLIPFPAQVKKLLKLLLPITSDSPYIFPSDKHADKPMHSETVNKALRRIENGKYIGRMVSHGFRGMASTILNENKFRSDVIEKQLAHQERNKVRGAYNHAEYLEERTEMMQWYADYLDKLKNNHG